MKYADMLTADRRLVTLRLLNSSPGYKCSEYVIHSALPGFGHDVSLDKVRTDLAWLQEQGLLVIDKPGGVEIARLTQRGVDVAEGRSIVPGVKRPGPEDD